MIAVTGATGHLGKLVVEDLIKRGEKPSNIVALIRDKKKAADLESQGVQLRVADYTIPGDIEKALAGVDKLLLVSGNELGQRLTQHTNVVNAAKKANVKLIAYTSITKADKSKMSLAGEHLATEKLVQTSGIPYVILRNDWYIENYTGQLPNYLEHGAIVGSAKDGKVAAGARSDYASAAAAVLQGKSKTNTIYELAGKPFTLTELADVVSQVSGKKVVYKDIPSSEYEKMLAGFGLPAPMAQMLSNSDEGIARGDLFIESSDLETLIGRKPKTLAEVVKSSLN